MQPPKFWYGAEGRDTAPVLQLLARPLSWIYAGVTASKIARTHATKVGPVVICVGNLTVGGTGKTPVVRAIRARLGEKGVTTATLSRGHGGRLKGPAPVTSTHTADDVGDEPLLHARDGAAWIARDRLAGAQAIAANGAQAILMDDGFQNPALAKDLSLLVFDAATGAGNGRVVPAGPLREPLKAGLARADAVIVMHNGKGDEDDAQSLHEALAAFRGVVLSARLEPAGAAPQGRLVAFAGIGRPDKFFDTLRMLGADVADFVSFPDHHPYAEADLERLRAHAQTHQARLVTTEKDHVRLPPHLRDTALTLPVTAVFDDAAALDALLDGALAKRKD